MQLPPPPRSLHWNDVRSWRTRTRQALIGQRLSLEPDVRATLGARARKHLLERIDLARYEVLGVYWPVRGEIDVRDLARAHLQAGGRVGLPVVIEKAAPVEFWSWQPGEALRRGVWNIPIPAKRDVLKPDALLVPLVGFDAQAYRLGYGGGYYDRTLAALAPRPYCIGLGFQFAALRCIFPQPHDVPMDVIVTDAPAAETPQQ